MGWRPLVRPESDRGDLGAAQVRRDGERDAFI